MWERGKEVSFETSGSLSPGNSRDVERALGPVECLHMSGGKKSHSHRTRRTWSMRTFPSGACSGV